MKLLIKTLIFLCFLSQYAKATENNSANESRLVMALERNGKEMLCGNKEYRSCLEIDENTCGKEIENIHENCFLKTKKNIAVLENNYSSGMEYAFCVSMSHMLHYHLAKINEVKACNERQKTNMDDIVKKYFDQNNISHGQK